jgi:rubrerythrin
MIKFEDLNPKEVLALAMDIERNNAERLESLANLYMNEREEIAKYFSTLSKEELDHLRILNDYWIEQFGNEQVPEINEMDVVGVIEAVEVENGEHMIFDDLTIEDALWIVKQAEKNAEQYYKAASAATDDEMLKSLYDRLADLEATHNAAIERFGKTVG